MAFAVITQILIGKRILNVDFKYHRRVLPKVIIGILIFHAWYGIQIFFL